MVLYKKQLTLGYKETADMLLAVWTQTRRSILYHKCPLETYHLGLLQKCPHWLVAKHRNVDTGTIGQWGHCEGREAC